MAAMEVQVTDGLLFSLTFGGRFLKCAPTRAFFSEILPANGY